jgi:hypothetical protein
VEAMSRLPFSKNKPEKMNISFVSVANYISPFVDNNNLPETLICRRQNGVTSNILLIQWPCYYTKRNNIALDI